MESIGTASLLSYNCLSGTLYIYVICCKTLLEMGCHIPKYTSVYYMVLKVPHAYIIIPEVITLLLLLLQ